jgi:pyruvate oxidase
LKAAFDQAAAVLAAGRPFVINAKITLKRGFPVEALKVAIKDGRVVETVDPAFNANDVEHHVDDLQGLFDYYDGEELKPLQHFLDKAQVTL